MFSFQPLAIGRGKIQNWIRKFNLASTSFFACHCYCELKSIDGDGGGFRPMVEWRELPSKAMVAFRATGRIGAVLTDRAGRDRMALSAMNAR